MTTLEFKDRINSFYELEENWNGYKCPPVSGKALEVALEVLAHLDSEKIIGSDISVSIFPVPRGGVQYEFDFKDNYAELEILEDGVMIFMLSSDNDGVMDFMLSSDRDERDEEITIKDVSEVSKHVEKIKEV